MVRTVVYDDFDIDHRETSQNACFHCFFDTGFNGADVFLRNSAANDFVFKFVAFALFLRNEFEPAVTILTTAAGLTLEETTRLDIFADGFAVSNLRFADVAVYFEFTGHAVDDDIQMEFAHTGDDGLAGFSIGLDFECRVFFSQTSQGNAHFFLVSFRLRFNGYGNNRIREFHLFKNDRVFFIAQCIACSRIFQANDTADIARVGFLDFFTVVSVHPEDTANTFFFTFCRVVDIGTGL